MDEVLRVQLVDQGFDWPAWISAGAAIATLLIVGITAGFALYGLWDARRTRHGQLVTEVLRDWTTPEALEAHRLHAKYTKAEIIALTDKIFGPAGKKPPKPEQLSDWSKLSLIANLIESLGVLASEGALTNEVVYKMWGGAILTAWPKWKDAVDNLRVYDNEPDTYYYFEEIALAVQRVSKKRKCEDA